MAFWAATLGTCYPPRTYTERNRRCPLCRAREGGHPVMFAITATSHCTYWVPGLRGDGNKNGQEYLRLVLPMENQARGIFWRDSPIKLASCCVCVTKACIRS